MSSTAPDIQPAEPLETPAASTPKVQNPAPKSLTQPPPGFKFVKVRKPDGAIVTVKRKLSPEELEVATAATTATATAATVAVDERKNVGSKPDASLKGDVTKPATPISPTSALPVSTTSPISSNGDSQQVVRSLEEPVSQAALEAQTVQHREKRMSRFKGSLIRGFGTVLGAAVPGMDIGEWNDDDEAVDFDDDVSMDDADDDDDDDDEVHDEKAVGSAHEKASEHNCE